MNKYGQLFKKISIHPLFWVISAISMVTGYFWELLALFFIVFAHELGHAITAQYFHWRINKIQILPFGGYCHVDEFGNRKILEEFFVIIAGPLQHIWIALFIALLEGLQVISSTFAIQFHQYNVMILLFNLLPIRPLDGGKLVHLILSKYQSYYQSFQISLFISFLLLVIFHFWVIILFPLHINIWLVLAYLYFCLWMDWKQRHYLFMRFLLERYYGKNRDIEKLSTLHAAKDDYIYQILTQFKRGCKHLIHIEGEEQSPIGKLDENELLHVYFSEKQVRAKLIDLVYEE